MNKTTGIGAGIGAVLIIAIIAYQVNETMNSTQYVEDFQSIGPLTIDKSKYLLGENVFAWMSLHPLEDGTVSFYRPGGELQYSIDYNGSRDPDPKFYFRVNLEPLWEICTKDDVVGTWTVVITGKTLTEDRMNLTTDPKEMEFQFMDKILPGVEGEWNINVCIGESEKSTPEIYNPDMSP